MAALLIALTSPLKLRGLLQVIADMPEFASVAIANDAQRTRAGLRARRVDVLVVDHVIGREVHAGLDGTQKLPRTVIVGSQRHVGSCPGPRPNPACAFVGEQVSTEVLRGVLRHVAACPRAHAERSECQPCPVRKTLRPPALPLSEREADIFERIGRGEGVSAIARALALSVKTIEAYRANIKRKLGLDSGHELLRAALRWEQGEFEPPPR